MRKRITEKVQLKSSKDKLPERGGGVVISNKITKTREMINGRTGQVITKTVKE